MVAIAQSAVPDDVKHDTPGQVIKQGQSLHIDVDLALVNVTVTDPYNRLVTGLDPDNFRIFETNVEQEIQYFSSEDVPISIGVIFDLSGSSAPIFVAMSGNSFTFSTVKARPPVSSVTSGPSAMRCRVRESRSIPINEDE